MGTGLMIPLIEFSFKNNILATLIATPSRLVKTSGQDMKYFLDQKTVTLSRNELWWGYIQSLDPNLKLQFQLLHTELFKSFFNSN